MITVKVEEKLFQNRYKVDVGRSHINIKNPDICRVECKTQECAVCCPAGCYPVEGNGQVVLITDGCLDAHLPSSARISQRGLGISAWGSGILFKFG